MSLATDLFVFTMRLSSALSICLRIIPHDMGPRREQISLPSQLRTPRCDAVGQCPFFESPRKGQHSALL